MKLIEKLILYLSIIACVLGISIWYSADSILHFGLSESLLLVGTLAEGFICGVAVILSGILWG